MSDKKKKKSSAADRAPDSASQVQENEEVKDAAAEEALQEEETQEAPGQDELLKAEKDRYLRLAAEYDNFRKRTQKEREALFTTVRSDTITQLLPVYDNLDRALKQETTDEAYKKGVQMTMNQLEDILKNLGVTPIDTVGQKFDANLHSAVMHVDDDSYGANEIVEEFQKGFTLGDKVIRFSMVKVAN